MKGIEPSSRDWKSPILAIRPHTLNPWWTYFFTNDELQVFLTTIVTLHLFITVVRFFSRLLQVYFNY